LGWRIMSQTGERMNISSNESRRTSPTRPSGTSMQKHGVTLPDG
jgi:hypothetical protein